MRSNNMPSAVMIAFFVVVNSLSIALGRVIHVDSEGIGGFTTIQAGINDANDGDTVLVAPGIYRGEGNRDIDFKGKAITVRSEDGPRTCIIDSEGSEADPHRGFLFQSKEGNDSVLKGFTITGGEPGRTNGSGGGIHCSNSSPSIRDCVIVGNVARGGGGISLGSSDAVISHCVIAGNYTRPLVGEWTFGGGGLKYSRGYPTIRNCTIYGNRVAGSAGGGAYCTDRGSILFINCILIGNEPRGEGSQLASGGCLTITGCPNVEIVNCCIEDDPNAIFVGNWSDPRKVPDDCIREDPLFARPGYWDPGDRPDYPYDDVWVDGDYHLQSQAGRWDPNSGSWVTDEVTSPCIDAGDPNSDFSGEVWPHGGRINMGAYGGTAEASLSAQPVDMFLPRIACIHWYDRKLAENCQSFLQAHGCTVTLMHSELLLQYAFDDYDLIMIATDTANAAVWANEEAVAALVETGKPVLGLGEGGYAFFGRLGLAIGSPNGARATFDSVRILDSNSALFTGLYSVAVPEDGTLRLCDSSAQHVVIYLWPAPPDNVTVFAQKVDDPGYCPLVAQQGHLLWGLTDSPDQLTEDGRRLFLNAAILTANGRLEPEVALTP